MDQLFEYLKYVFSLPLIGMIIFQAVNYWNAEDLEKKLMTNYQRLLLNVSLIVVGSLILTMLTSLLVLIKKENLSIGLVLGGFALSFILLSVSSLLTWVLTSFLSLKPEFEIVLIANQEPWRVLKIIQNKKLLVCRGENELLIISNYDNKLIKKVKYVDGWRTEFYKGNIGFTVFIIVATSLVVVSPIFAYLIGNIGLKLISILIFTVSLAGLFVAYMNSKWYKKEQNKKN